MEKELSKEAQERAKEKARKNIENFLKDIDELDKKDPYIKDPFKDEYDKKIYDEETIKILDDYGKRKSNVMPQWKELKAKARIEARNGYLSLTEEEKYEVFIKRRIEAEKILQEAHLGHKDAIKLREDENGLVATLVELYEIYGLHKFGKSTDEEETSDEE